MTVAGLPLDSWILVLASAGIGLAFEVAFLRARRRWDASGRKDADR